MAGKVTCERGNGQVNLNPPYLWARFRRDPHPTYCPHRSSTHNRSRRIIILYAPHAT